MEANSKPERGTPNPARTLRKHETLYQSLIRSLPIGLVIYDPDLRIVEINEVTASMFGIADPSEVTGRVAEISKLEYVTLEGEPLPWQELPSQKVLRTLQPVIGETLGIKRPNGEVLWLYVNSVPVLDAESQTLLHIISTFSDISDLIQLQTRLQEMNTELQIQTEELLHSQRLIEQANRRFEELFENVPVACYTFDREGTVHEWNQAAEQLYGWSKRDILFRPLFGTLFEPECKAAVWETMLQVLAGASFVGIQSADRHADGSTLWVMRSMFPLRGPDNSIIGGIVANVNVTDRVLYEMELKELNARLRALAVTDGLTGLFNHRAFQEQLESEFRRAQRYKQPLSFIMVDVDRFKQYNDTFGHLAGDEVLRTLADILRGAVRSTDILTRYGGEEFAVLLPNTNLEGGTLTAERLRLAIERYPWELQPVTASFGVAEYHSGLESPSQLIEAADKALYAAKRAGRNCVRTGPRRASAA